MLLFAGACRQSSTSQHASEKEPTKDTLLIQVVGNFNKQLLSRTKTELAKHFKTIKVNAVQSFPRSAYYVPRKRYKADTIIAHLAKQTPEGLVSIALTHEDISTKKGAIADYGIMGLGFCPGRACVVSTFRLKQENLEEQFFKLCLHELGHTAGLPHCKQQNCFMRDAEGKNNFDEERGFCESCRTYLNQRGWHLK